MRACLTFLFLVLCLCHQSQNNRLYTISGFVTEKGSQEHLPGALVHAAHGKSAVSCNEYGFYSLSLPASDTLRLLVAMVGYRTQTITLQLKKDIELNVSLQAENTLQEVDITIRQSEKISQDVRMSTINLPVEKVKEIPALLGEKDVLKVLQLLPGVQKGREGSSGFYVRGGGPDQNLIILDDAPVYNAFHLFGFFSLFNGDALKSVELTKGGFPARYGGRLSSVLDMQMKDGDKEKFRGEAGIGLISSRLVLEGPIIKDKCSFLVSGRRTYVDALSTPFQPKERKGGYFFYDFNAKINYTLGKKDRLFVSGYFGKDKFYSRFSQGQSASKIDFSWGNATSTIRWNHVFSNKIFANTSLIFTDYQLNIANENKFEKNYFSLVYKSGIRDYGIKSNFDFFPRPEHHLRAGIQAVYHRFTPGAQVVQGMLDTTRVKSPVLIESGENAAFFEEDWTPNKVFRVNAGLRLTHFNIRKKNYFNAEPRISLRIALRHQFAIKAAYSIMNQYMHLLSNTGIGLPTDLWVPATTKAPPMQSWQVATGVAKDFSKHGIELSVEGYYKKMHNVLGYKEGASFLAAFGGNGEGDESWENKVTSGQGWSYGAEFLLKKDFGKISGWVGYTLSWTELQFDELNFGKKFYARYDRKHDVSFVGIYKLNKKVTFSLTWVYGTGNAITLPLNSYQANMYGGSYTPENPTALNQSQMFNVQDFGTQRNAFRMSPYHRLDAGVQFHKKMKRVERTFEISVYNAYNRQNPFYYFIQADEKGKQELMQVSLFPIIPGFSWNIKF